MKNKIFKQFLKSFKKNTDPTLRVANAAFELVRDIDENIQDRANKSGTLFIGKSQYISCKPDSRFAKNACRVEAPQNDEVT